MEHGRFTVSAVSGKRDESDFLTLPLRLHREDPLWVYPLPGEERARWDPRTNPVLRSRWTRRFLARCGDRAVGRVAVIIDPAFNERWVADAGFFGFFECEDDLEAAIALFDAAEAELRRRGVSSVFGPIALSTHGEVGALVEGFDSPPMVLSPYNPRYVPGLIESAGYTAHIDYHSYQWLPSTPLSPAAERMMQSVRGRERSGDPGAGPGKVNRGATQVPAGEVTGVKGGVTGVTRGAMQDVRRGAMPVVTVRPVDKRRWEAECRTIHGLYNECFDQVWGFVPMTWDEFEAQAAQFRRVLRPELVRVAECGGEAVGFALALPDANEALRPLRGRLWPFGWLRLLTALRRIRGARFLLIGVRPGFKGHGIAVRLAAGVADGGRRIGITHAEASLVRSDNEEANRIVSALQTTPLKTYRLFHKRIKSA